MIVVQILAFRNIHSSFTYIDFEGQSYAFLSDILLSLNLCEDQCIRIEELFLLYCWSDLAQGNTNEDILLLIERPH